MRRLHIRHVTRFTYERDVSESYNEARMQPGSSEQQVVLSSTLEVRPSSALNAYVDYFGTRVSAFEILAPHSSIEIVADSLVEVRPRPAEHRAATWPEIADDIRHSVRLVECLEKTTSTLPPTEIVEIARSFAADHARIGDAALHIATRIGGDVEYLPGSTGVRSTAADAWEHRSGVCQDIAHITLGALREVGIPARYVSGYLHPQPAPEVGVAVAGESHAWIEFFDGEWQGFDPTNLCAIDDRYVLVGRGRDYNDVAPLRGLYDGPPESDQFVEVTITSET